MRDVVIAGVGMTNFGRFPEIPYYKLGAAAVLDALRDAGMTWKDIPVVYSANTNNGFCAGELVEAELGHTGISDHKRAERLRRRSDCLPDGF